MQPFFMLAMAIAYLLVMVGLIKSLRWWFDYCDARAVSDFERQCLLAEAEEARVRLRRSSSFGEDTQ